ncbi:MAG: hypothetical protein ABIP79_15335 [Chitinophagaceae bacterium]
MKKLQFLILCILFMSARIGAQTFVIDKSEITFENKLRPCLFVQFDADAKTVKKGWADYMKKNYKIKVKGIGLLSDKDLIEANDVTINSISDKRMNMYARVTDISGGSEMKYFMSFGYDFFIGPDEYYREFDGMFKVLNDFSISFLNNYYADETSAVLKKIKAYEKDMKKNDKTIASNVKKSNKGSAAVASALESKNYSLRLENEQLESKITTLKNNIEAIKDKQKGIIIR